MAAVDPAKLNRMLAAIGSGQTKDTYPFPLTPDEAAAWDTLEGEVADIKAKGLMVDVPGEWPAPDDGDGPAPAQDAAPETPASGPPAAPTAAPEAPAPNPAPA